MPKIQECFKMLCHSELRERRLKADKMLQWSILSESPSSYAAKGQESIIRCWIKFSM